MMRIDSVAAQPDRAGRHTVCFEDGEEFGVIEDILSARTDIYYISTKNGRVIAPWLKSYNANFDIEKRKVTVLKEEFLKEINYEN